MAFLPALLSGNPFKMIEKVFNSPEHNFKMDLDSALQQAGIDDQLRARIRHLLNTGKDSEIGPKLNALMAAGVIPPEMMSVIAQLAKGNGVSSQSINPDNIGDEMDSSDCSSLIGGEFPDEVDSMDDDDSGFGNDGDGDSDSDGDGDDGDDS